ncbi:MAG: hypothetical protein KBD82_11380 [Rhodoferax sp.]|jgi:hypothetical protein|uniref:hypothetical protein n=1 Tax=Rhodoferax sp. TaxID=50421 RepID=UPI001B674D8C|nr:hypothetical protein [Rhodoferax sp.]MBP9736225.1 hypothetical protein [Rhodoferax sp.]
MALKALSAFVLSHSTTWLESHEIRHWDLIKTLTAIDPMQRSGFTLRIPPFHYTAPFPTCRRKLR